MCLLDACSSDASDRSADLPSGHSALFDGGNHVANFLSTTDIPKLDLESYIQNYRGQSLPFYVLFEAHPLT